MLFANSINVTIKVPPPLSGDTEYSRSIELRERTFKLVQHRAYLVVSSCVQTGGGCNILIKFDVFFNDTVYSLVFCLTRTVCIFNLKWDEGVLFFYSLPTWYTSSLSWLFEKGGLRG